jgi:transcriptional regulator with GAF, ATPase, and Fis domain
MIGEGVFRKDLYFRLQEFVVVLPPLRERREDIPALARYFAERMAAHLDREITHLTPEALSLLSRQEWLGNVRELEHAVRRAVIGSPGPAIRAEDISLGMGRKDRQQTEEWVSLEEHERGYILRVLEKTGWVVMGEHGAAKVLGLHEATLRGRMRKLGIVRPKQQ